MSATQSATVWLVFIAMSCWGAVGRAEGPLRVHPGNHRYFTDDSGKAIYLAGHQWFNDLQYNAWNQPVDADWPKYLDFMQRHGMNYLRNWIIWSVGTPLDGKPSPVMPFRRTGPGQASDGQAKFDLHQFDADFFRRLEIQVREAQEKDVYVSIMLFDVYGFMSRGNFWAGNLFNGANNVNGIDADVNQDGEGMEFFYTTNPRLIEIQHAYVRKVIDTVNRFDHVFFEIANELESKEWQYAMIRFIKDYEAGKPKQHLVYMSPGGRNRRARWSPLSRKDLLDSPADLYAVTKWQDRYRGDPPVQPPLKPVFMDMDHIAATDNDGDNDWNNSSTTPWKLLTRGYHQSLYDYDYWKPGENRKRWELTRHNIGATVAYGRRMDLAKMHPRSDLSSTRFCLAHPGNEYLVFNSTIDPFTVSGLLDSARYDLEWFDVENRRVTARGEFVSEGTSRRFRPPYSEAVLYLKHR